MKPKTARYATIFVSIGMMLLGVFAHLFTGNIMTTWTYRFSAIFGANLTVLTYAIWTDRRFERHIFADDPAEPGEANGIDD